MRVIIQYSIYQCSLLFHCTVRCGKLIHPRWHPRPHLFGRFHSTAQQPLGDEEELATSTATLPRVFVVNRVHVCQNLEGRRSRQGRRCLVQDRAVARCDPYGNQPLQTLKLSPTAGGTHQVFRPDGFPIEDHGSYNAHIEA